MTRQLPIHASTSKSIDAFAVQPSHALIISGMVGSDKSTIAKSLAASMLGTDLEEHPHLILVQPEDKQSIGIDQIRELLSKLSLIVPTDADIKRVIIIKNADVMTTEAQNALLKALEEPPEGTVLILLTDQDSLLPTIKSRAQTIRVRVPNKSELTEHFSTEGYSSDKIKQALAISGGLPRLTADILADEDHQYLIAADRAKTILRQSAYERLTTLDELVKDPALLTGTLNTLNRIAEYSIAQGANDPPRWQTILQATNKAQQDLSQNAQPKLALTSLMLSI